MRKQKEAIKDDVLRSHGKPEIGNIDQGSQFTNDALKGVLLDAGIASRMI